MRWLFCVVMLAPAALVQAQDNDAEKLYRAFEKKLVEAKACYLEFKLNPDQNFPKAKGKLTLAAGNKMNINFEAEEGNIVIKATQISDGKTIASKYTENGQAKTKAEPTPKNWTVNVSTCLARGGFFVTFATGWPPPDHAKIVLKDFKMQPQEKIGDRMAQVIEFKMLIDGQSTRVCKMWFDTKTNLPLKRTIEVTQDGKLALEATEFYAGWEFEPALDEKTFELPK